MLLKNQYCASPPKFGSSVQQVYLFRVIAFSELMCLCEVPAHQLKILFHYILLVLNIDQVKYLQLLFPLMKGH